MVFHGYSVATSYLTYVGTGELGSRWSLESGVSRVEVLRTGSDFMEP